MNLLFTCAGRRHYLIDFFQQAKPANSLIVATDMQLSAPAMAVVDKKYAVSPVYAPGYIDEIKAICANDSIDAILSLNDLELPILSEHRNEFEAMGVTLIVSSKEVIDICFDKWKTIEFASRIGLSTPKTYLNLPSAVNALNTGALNFPLVIKPRWGTASIGIEFPESVEELEKAYWLLSKKLFRSIIGEISMTDSQNAILIQEKVEGKEYGLDVFNDLEGNNLAVYVKEKISMRAGETDKAVLRNHAEIEQMGKKLGNSLRHIGNLDCDIMSGKNGYALLEMNPRFGGGYPFSQLSGANFPAVIYALINHAPIRQEWLSKKYDTIYAKYDSLIDVS